MSGTIPMHRDDDSGHGISLDGWVGLAAKQGVTAAIALGVLWFAGYYVVIPMVNSSQKFTDSATRSMENRDARDREQIEINRQQAVTNEKVASALMGVQLSQQQNTEVTKQLLQVQQQVLDATKRGAWRENP
jgi:hypothetical protein